ncbi:MAG TPA: glycosyltransferase [Chloroflexota bacterium]|nr:glycosyltransferase [Chloroflexota bacterium]
MKVLHLITDLDVGGAEMMLFKLVTQPACAGIQPVVVSMKSPGSIGHELARQGIGVHALHVGLDPGSPVAVGRLIQLLRQERPDVVQTWMYHADLLGLVCAAAAGIRQVIWNVRCSNLRLGDYSIVTRLLRGACARFSPYPAGIVVNSRSGRDFHTALGYRARAWHVIPNGFDTDRFQPDASRRQQQREALGLDGDVPVIGLAARVDQMKDHPTFLMAAAKLRRTHPTVRFVLAGRGTADRCGPIARWIAELGLGQVVSVLGEVHDMAAWYPALDICALSSAYGEGFPNVLGEAMACGLPCVSTAVGDAADIIGDTGLVVPVGNPDALAQAWADLIQRGAAARSHLGARARDRVVERYSLKAVAGQYARLYQSVGENRCLA